MNSSLENYRILKKFGIFVPSGNFVMKWATRSAVVGAGALEDPATFIIFYPQP